MEKPDRPAGNSAGQRAVRLSPEPSISVVVVSEDQRSSLDASLGTLLGPSRRRAAEIIVVRAGSGPAERSQLEADYPAARFVFAPPGTPFSRLRAQGMAAAEGDIVLFVDDRRPLSRDLIAKLEAAESGPSEAAKSGRGRRDSEDAAQGGSLDPTSRGATASQAALAATGRQSAGPRGREQQVDG